MEFAVRNIQFARRNMEFARRNIQFARRNIQFARRNIQFARRNIQFARHNTQFARRGRGWERRGMVSARYPIRSCAAPWLPREGLLPRLGTAREEATNRSGSANLAWAGERMHANGPNPWYRTDWLHYGWYRTSRNGGRQGREACRNAPWRGRGFPIFYGVFTLIRHDEWIQQGAVTRSV
jgi:hypothetical protein